MYLKGKKILILGLGITGVSTIKALYKLGADVVISDLKKEEELEKYLKEISSYPVELRLGTNDIPLDNIDMIIKSPGILPDIPVLKRAEKAGIEVITDIELAYRIMTDNNFIAITGTNGKTTTTTLTGELFKKAGYNTYVTGNIGVGILWKVANGNKDDVFVIEASSFQLANTKHFKPKVSLILNITPDHMNWHKSYENYINAKKKIFINQDENDYTILNYDDEILRKIGRDARGQLIWFSTDSILNRGVYIDEDYIVINDGKTINKIMPYKEVNIPGKHNLQNALGAVSIGWTMGIPFNIIKDVLSTFEGVEHRIEYVTEIDGVKFYNDSKGTNADASIKAVETLENSIILIAGGMDKGNEFDDFVKTFEGRVKDLVLLGETKEKIKKTALKYNFNNIFMVDNMKEAVKKSFRLSQKGDKVLLSPACASWDMYENYEVRGRDFKKAVMEIKGDSDGKEKIR